MEQTQSFDLVVIGGGPAGYVGAIRATQLGMSVACVESDKLGGVCLNWGCIPTKALLAGAEFYWKLKHEASTWGIEADNVRHNWRQVIDRSRGVVSNLNKGIHGLFRKNKVHHIEGRARIVSGGSICTTEVRDAAGNLTQSLNSRHVLICTGAVPRSLKGVDYDRQKIISYKEAMVLPTQPKKLLIVGAGAIGMEFAYFYNAFGTHVTVIEMLPRVLPNEDADVSAAVAKAFKKQGIECLTAMKTTSVDCSGEDVHLTIAPAANDGPTQRLSADNLLVAVGVQANIEGLLYPDAARLGIELDKGHIKVDRTSYCSSLEGVHAVGDVIGPPWLAHVASEEAIVCVERIAGHNPMLIDYQAIPTCTYCLPQVASLGKTEQDLNREDLKAGEDYTVGKFPFHASGKAQAIGATDGFIKILADGRDGEILGVHMVGESVTELLAEIGLAKRFEASTSELIATMHAHPTLSEAVHEAALGTQGRMIHS